MKTRKPKGRWVNQADLTGADLADILFGKLRVKKWRRIRTRLADRLDREIQRWVDRLPKR